MLDVSDSTRIFSTNPFLSVWLVR